MFKFRCFKVCSPVPMFLSCSLHHSSDFRSLLNITISVVCKGLLKIHDFLHLIDQALRKDSCLFILYFHFKCLACGELSSFPEQEEMTYRLALRSEVTLLPMLKGKNTEKEYTDI